MKRFYWYGLFVFLLPFCCSLQARAQSAAPDYSLASSWVCRPGAEDVCTKGLDATVVSADGARTKETFPTAADPLIDCFYVYPTASRESTDYADMTATPELQVTTNAQVGRLGSRCRVFAPVYRQMTLAGLQRRMRGTRSTTEVKGFDGPEADVLAAWNYYLAHDNHGRGVVLVGHSQGTILLQQMMQSAIDGKPAQSLLVSAFLAGDPSLAVPPGKTVGGTFQHIPLCAAATQVGCAYAWASFQAADHTPQWFGYPRKDGLVSACVSPSAPGGGSASLKTFHPSYGAPGVSTPWVGTVGRLSGECKVTPLGSGFRVTVGDVPDAAFYKDGLKRSEIKEGWGLHVLDLSLVQGNILNVMDAEIATWRRLHGESK